MTPMHMASAVLRPLIVVAVVETSCLFSDRSFFQLELGIKGLARKGYKRMKVIIFILIVFNLLERNLAGIVDFS